MATCEKSNTIVVVEETISEVGNLEMLRKQGKLFNDICRKYKKFVFTKGQTFLVFKVPFSLMIGKL